jgi:hypothetical protein
VLLLLPLLLLLLLPQGPQRGMGVALVTCISGCKCEPLKIDAVNTDRSSELDSLRTQVWLKPSSFGKALQGCCNDARCSLQAVKIWLEWLPATVFKDAACCAVLVMPPTLVLTSCMFTGVTC